jgi:LPXTG-motif cell wall-anchored protein
VRHISVLTAVYALVAVFALPGPLSASDEQVPAAVEGGQVTPAAPESPPAAEAEASGALEGQAEAQAPADPETPAGQAPAPAPDAQQVVPEPAPAPSAAAAPALAEDPATVPARAQRRAGRERADKRKPGRVVVRAAASQSVTIRDYAFSPRTVTVQPGDTVTWTNRHGVRHSATAEDGTFDTGLLGRGESGEHTFREAGTYQYVCTPHPNMQGTVVVDAASTGGDVDSGADPGADGDSSSTSGSSSDTGGSSSDASGTSSGSTAGDTSSGSTSTLPDTGADVPTLTLLGLLFLALGAAVQSRARRKRSTTEGRSGS